MNEKPKNCSDEEWKTIQSLADPDSNVRDNAAGILHAMGSICSIPALLNQLESEPNEYIRGNIVFYASELCLWSKAEYDELFIGTLKRVLKSESSESVKIEIEEALERITHRYGANPENKIGKTLLIQVTKGQNHEDAIGKITRFSEGSVFIDQNNGNGELGFQIWDELMEANHNLEYSIRQTGEVILQVDYVKSVFYQT